MVYTYRTYDPAVETEEQWWDRTRRWKTAYHEAGHAWIDTRLGWVVWRVTLDPRVHSNPDRNGLTETFRPDEPGAAVLISYMAGKVCERLVLPRHLWKLSMMGGWYLDDESARRYLADSCGVRSYRGQDKWLREAEAGVRALVADPANRSEIDRLAESLMESLTLTGSQVRAIVRIGTLVA